VIELEDGKYYWATHLQSKERTVFKAWGQDGNQWNCDLTGSDHSFYNHDFTDISGPIPDPMEKQP
jgi:hypothetical protein